MSRLPRWFSFLACLVLGCAESGPVKSPDAEASEAAPAASSTEPAASDAEAPAEPAAAVPSAPATREEVQAVLQLVIDDEALSSYLHLEQPDRFPLRVAGKDIPEGLELVKATKPVIVVADAAAEKKPLLLFTEIQVSGDEASVRYRYDVEKVRGASTLRKRDGHWVLSRSRVSEH